MQIPSFCWNPDCSKGKERNKETKKTIKNYTFLPKSMQQKKSLTNSKVSIDVIPPCSS